MAIFLSLRSPSARSAHSLPCWSSRPQVRKASHSLRSVTLGLVAEGVIEEDVVVGIDFGGGDGHAGVEVADDELDAVADELVGDRDALLGIGNVVALLELDLLAENAASLVEVLNRLSDAVGQLRAERGVRAGDRAGDAELDLRVRRAGEAEAGGEHETRQPVFLHTTLPVFGAQTAPPRRKRSHLRQDQSVFFSGCHLLAGRFRAISRRRAPNEVSAPARSGRPVRRPRNIASPSAAPASPHSRARPRARSAPK